MTTLKQKLIALFLFSFALSGSNAQQATTASGGDALGAGGSVSYSVGQVVYTTVSTVNYVINQGVQQPYEFVALGIDNNKGITLSYAVYPNPTTSSVILRLDNVSTDNLFYELYDISGKMIYSKKITANETAIPMDNLASASYLLKVINNNEEVKTYKIIKN